MAKMVRLVCAEEVTETVATDEKTEDGYPVMEEQSQPCGALVDVVEIEEGRDEDGEKLAKAIAAGKVKGRGETPCAAGHTGKVQVA